MSVRRGSQPRGRVSTVGAAILVLLAALALTALAIADGVIPASNLARNASFEVDDGHWGSCGGQISRVTDSLAPDETHALEDSYDPLGGCGGYTVDDDGDTVANAQAGYDYTAKAWVRANSVSDGDHIEIVIREWNSTGFVDNAVESIEISDDGYVPIEVSYSPQVTGNQLDFLLRRDGSEVATGDKFFVDAISIDYRADNLVENASFEQDESGWGSCAGTVDAVADRLTPHSGNALEVADTTQRRLWRTADDGDGEHQCRVGLHGQSLGPGQLRQRWRSSRHRPA